MDDGNLIIFAGDLGAHRRDTKTERCLK